MHPVLVRLGPLALGAFKIGPLLLRWYGAMMALAILLAVPLSARMGEQFGIPRTLVVDSLAVPLMATLLAGARAGYVVSHFQEFAGDPLAAVRPPFAGLASHGAIAVGLAFLAVWSRRHRRPLWRGPDASAPATLGAATRGRCGHLMNRGLYGDPSRPPRGAVVP